MRAAGLALPFEKPKLSAQAMVMVGGDFAARLDRALERSRIAPNMIEPPTVKWRRAYPQKDLAWPSSAKLGSESKTAIDSKCYNACSRDHWIAHWMVRVRPLLAQQRRQGPLCSSGLSETLNPKRGTLRARLQPRYGGMDRIVAATEWLTAALRLCFSSQQ